MSPYSPLAKENLGISVADAMLSREVVPLSPMDSFSGAGIYAIYYVGTLPVYRKLAQRNRNAAFAAPIYVGKAVPPGARKGGYGVGGKPGPVLYKRLTEHAKSIEQCNNLDIVDFLCRYLVVEDIWIPLGESLLIEKFEPIWNNVVEGFGNHDPGKGRRNQRRSLWDVLHPGRAWAIKLAASKKTPEEIVSSIEDELSEFG